MNHKENNTKTQNSILIVDDFRDNLRLLSRLLTEAGYLVRPIADGKLVISSARATPPDLILLDIMMPDMDGYEVCDALKSDDALRDIPVIFISALDGVFDKVKAFSAGGVDFITKPFQPAEVLARVKTHITLKNLQNTLIENNRRLTSEIVERKRIEEAMRQRNWELSLITQMNTQLQACNEESKTYEVLKNICSQLFPSDSGCLYLIANEPAALVTAMDWGDSPPKARIPDDTYWENPRGQLHTIEQASGNSLSLYLHSSEERQGDFPYILRNVSGQALGVLFLYSGSTPGEEANEKYIQPQETKQLIATRVVEQYALFLVNFRLRDALRREAIRDPLTKLYNRRYMEEALNREVQQAERRQAPVGIIMLDVDHFKDFNDTYGHEAGDVVLEQLGELLQNNIRGGDIACRYGGEEFLLILPDTTLEIADIRARQLLERSRQLQVVHQQETYSVTISLGVSALPEHGHTIHEIVNAADTALYKAKHRGRDQVVIAHVTSTESQDATSAA
ncbi:MAG: diguanylate cyclase [bacterium]|nr:diguanylate cyclase [bacterium]